MADPRNPFNYPINPSFGQGIYRRRIRLEQQQAYVTGLLEDCNHGFAVTVFHDGQGVTRVEGRHHRIPFTTCGGAIEPLQALVGIPLGLSSSELGSRVNPRANCTHWLDLAMLAILHAGRNETVRTYDIEVPDEMDIPTTAKVFCNGQLQHEWQVKDWQLYAPAHIAGNTLFKGFSAWANSAFDNEDSRQAAFALQKGYFVARARRFDMDKIAGESAKVHTMMAGACYSYSEPQASVAVRTSLSTRDFTHTPEQLLTFT